MPFGKKCVALFFRIKNHFEYVLFVLLSAAELEKKWLALFLDSFSAKY